MTVLRAWREKKQEIEQAEDLGGPSGDESDGDDTGHEKREERFHDFYWKLRRRIDRRVRKRSRKSGSDRKGERAIKGLLFLPDLFYLMVKLLFDREVPASNKGALLGGILYIMSPLDILPDFIPVAGWADDLVIAVLALNKYLDLDNPVIRRKAEEYWLNDKAFFSSFMHLVNVSEEMLDVLPKKLFHLFLNFLEPDKWSDKESSGSGSSKKRESPEDRSMPS